MKRFSKPIALGLAGAILFGAAAYAQSPREILEMEDRIEDLEEQLRALQRSAAQGDLPAVAAGGGVNGNQAVLLADMEVRLSQLQNQISLLTGQNEEILHRQQRIEEQFERFQRDVDLRFEDIGTSPALPADEAAATSGDAFTNSGAAPTTQVADTSVLPEGSAQDQYDYSFSLLRKGDYASAESAFEAFLQKYPADELSGNAQYWLGETHYVRKNYPQAAAAFLKGFQEFPGGNKGPDNLLKLGMTLAAMGQTREACTAFEELQAAYPEAPQTIVDRTAVQKERNGC